MPLLAIRRLRLSIVYVLHRLSRVRTEGLRSRRLAERGEILFQILLRHSTIKHFQLAILGLISVANSHAQTTARSYGRVEVAITKEKKPKRIYAKAEIKTAFTGGDSSWVQSLEQTLNQSIPYKNGAKPGKYIVSVIFIADKEGDISDVRCVNEPVGYGMEEQVLRAIKKKTTWFPSPQGVPVRPYRTSLSKSSANN